MEQQATDIYNELNQHYPEFLLEETMMIAEDFDIETESDEIAKKLMEVILKELTKTDAFGDDKLSFTEEDFNSNKDGVAEVFSEMIVEMQG